MEQSDWDVYIPALFHKKALSVPSPSSSSEGAGLQTTVGSKVTSMPLQSIKIISAYKGQKIKDGTILLPI